MSLQRPLPLFPPSFEPVCELSNKPYYTALTIALTLIFILYATVICIHYVLAIDRLVTHVVFVALEDVTKVASFLTIDEGKQLLVFGVQSAK